MDIFIQTLNWTEKNDNLHVYFDIFKIFLWFSFSYWLQFDFRHIFRLSSDKARKGRTQFKRNDVRCKTYLNCFLKRWSEKQFYKNRIIQFSPLLYVSLAQMIEALCENQVYLTWYSGEVKFKWIALYVEFVCVVFSYKFYVKCIISSNSSIVEIQNNDRQIIAATI